MAKQGGLGDNFYVAGVDVSGDTQSFQRIGGGPSVLDFTDITQLAKARQGASRDGEMQLTSFFDSAANKAHSIYKTLPYTDEQMMYMRSTILGAPGACIMAKQLNYDGKIATTDEFLLQIDGKSNSFGLEWGVQLTAGIRSDVTATNGTGVDDLAGSPISTAFGGQAYMQAFSFTGTSCTITVQDSLDNVTFANLAGGGFTPVVGVTTQRISFGDSTTIRRYLRVATTGTFSQCSFAVVVVRNQVANAVF